MIYSGNYFITNIHQTASAQNLTSCPSTKYFINKYGCYDQFNKISGLYDEEDVFNINPRIINQMWVRRTHWYNCGPFWDDLYTHACTNNNYYTIREFLKEGGNGVLWEFNTIIIYGDIETIKLVYEIENLHDHMQNYDLCMCFTDVCLYQDVETVEFIMSLQEFDEECYDKGFEEASESENYEIMSFLLDYISPNYIPKKAYELAIMINNPKFYHLINIDQADNLLCFVDDGYELYSHWRDAKIYIDNLLLKHPKLEKIKNIIMECIISMSEDEETLESYMGLYDEWLS